MSFRALFVPLLQCALDSCLNIVVGTKLDLVASKGRAVEAADGLKLARELNPGTDCQSYFETSSLTGDNVNEVFEFIFKTCLMKADKDNEKIQQQQTGGSTIKLHNPVESNKSSCC
jgi:Ras family